MDLYPTIQSAPSPDGSLFRGRYKAILIDADEYLSAVVRYVHLNPAQAGIVTQPQADPPLGQPPVLPSAQGSTELAQSGETSWSRSGEGLSRVCALGKRRIVRGVL